MFATMNVYIRKRVKRAAVLMACVGISASVWLAYCNESTLPGLMLSAVMTWVNWFVGDPSLDEVTDALQTVNDTMAAIQFNIGAMQETMGGMQADMNRRFDNLNVALNTPPGAPAGVDETVIQGDPNWVRGPDPELEDRARRRRVNLPDTIVLPPVPLLAMD
jgi:hypothetical protein